MEGEGVARKELEREETSIASPYAFLGKSLL